MKDRQNESIPPDDAVDGLWDRLEHFFGALIDREFHRTWFQWLEWVTIAAVIYAENTQSRYAHKNDIANREMA